MEQRFQTFEKQLDLPSQPVQSHGLKRRQLFGVEGGDNPDHIPGAGSAGNGAGWDPGNGLTRLPDFVAFGGFWGDWYCY